jgi:hypothetical protein
MHVFHDLLDIVPPAQRIADKDIIEFFIDIQFVRVHCMEFQVRESFFRQLNSSRVGIDSYAV